MFGLYTIVLFRVLLKTGFTVYVGSGRCCGFALLKVDTVDVVDLPSSFS
jgi:hypothetical protein